MYAVEQIYFTFLRIANSFFKVMRTLERRYRILSAKAQGMKIGANTRFVGMQNFGSEPFLISIGESCLVTDNVRFITHDGAIQVPLIKKGASVIDVYGNRSVFGTIYIGNNVFIGVGTIILLGAIIGDNTIIAAGSVVKGNFGSNSVLAGNPAKVICSVDDYFSKNMERILNLTDVEKKYRKAAILYSCSVK